MCLGMTHKACRPLPLLHAQSNSTSSSSGGGGGSTWWDLSAGLTLFLIIGPSCLICCTAVLAAVVLRYVLPKSHRSLLGKVKVPPVSSRTTLVVTE